MMTLDVALGKSSAFGGAVALPGVTPVNGRREATIGDGRG
jgi:hypothetical protein